MRKRTLDQPDEFTMSLGEHLEELRRRLILALVVPLPIAIVLFFFADFFIELLARPFRTAMSNAGLPVQMQVLSPPELLITEMKLAIIFGIVLSAPWILWQLWLFIRPGLYASERRFVHLLIPGSAVLTAAGVALLYFIMLPLVLAVLIGFGQRVALPTIASGDADDPNAIVLPDDSPSIPILDRHPVTPKPGQLWIIEGTRQLSIALRAADDDEDAAASGQATSRRIEIVSIPLLSSSLVAQQFRLKDYINFVLLLMLGITIAFQMPLVILLLGWVGLVTPQWLAQQRRYALFVCAIISALITPADAISMIAMLIPLYFLYELGIVLLRLAPASKVASGEAFTLRQSDKPIAQSEQTDATEQSADSPRQTHDEQE